MNEPAIRLEEQIISLFPDRETQVYHGWILKRMGKHLFVYPFYKFSEGNISDNIRKCEEISRQNGMECVFRIVEHTNYHLSSILTDTGYTLQKVGVVGELCLTDSERCLIGEKKECYGRLFLKKGTGREIVEYVIMENDVIVGIKRHELLFLPDGNLPDSLSLADILQFSIRNGVTKILADIPEKDELPKQYERAGFNMAYLYRCYQKKEDLKNGFTK